jgi:hypothetical protein
MRTTVRNVRINVRMLGLEPKVKESFDKGKLVAKPEVQKEMYEHP